MPMIAEAVRKKGERGVRFHEPSQQFIAEVGYHEVCEIHADGTVTEKRVRTTHYLGGLHDRNAHLARYRSIKADWEGTVKVLRAEYDAAQERRRRENLPSLPRFKPVWPGRRVVRSVRANSRALRRYGPATPLAPALTTHTLAPALTTPPMSPLLNLTIREAYAIYVEQQKVRIGLMAGKGVNSNTYEKHVQSLTLGLALNESYNRPNRPIDLDKRLGALTAADYEAFVRFWFAALIRFSVSCLERTISLRISTTVMIISVPWPQK